MLNYGVVIFDDFTVFEVNIETIATTLCFYQPCSGM